MEPRRDAKDYQSLCVSYLPARSDSLDRQEKEDDSIPDALVPRRAGCWKWVWCGVDYARYSTATPLTLQSYLLLSR